MQSSCYGDRQNSVEGRNVLYIQAMFIWLLLQNPLLHEYSSNKNFRIFFNLQRSQNPAFHLIKNGSAENLQIGFLDLKRDF